jgi:N-acetylglucosamine-6-phosphate deacetylase
MATKSYRGRTLTGQAVTVTVIGERIESVERAAGGDELPLIAPPLVDLQQNGALGFANNRLHEHPQALRQVAAFLRRHGVGRALFTTSTYDYDLLLKSLAEFDRQLQADGDLEHLWFGAFSEGIYISRQYGWRGGHDPQFMRDPNWDEWAGMQEAAGGRIWVFNVDPELPGALATIRRAVQEDICVAMGHCGPSRDAIRAAADAGATMVTHFGNGAPPQVHRHRNPFWTWLAEDRLSLGLIADGHHLPGEVILAAIAAKGREKVFLVSDASGHSGRPVGDYGNFVIEPGGRCRIKNEEMLAGAWFQADRNVERMCELGWSLADAWRQQSVIPASIIGLELPRLAAGQEAEFVLARYDGKELRLEQVVDRGQELLTEPVTPRMGG